MDESNPDSGGSEPLAPNRSLVRVGRPTSYRPEYTEQATKLCLLGAIDEDLADFFGVCVATISNWKNTHPEFLEAIHAGKRVADAEIASKLYEKAKGAEWLEEQPFKLKRTEYAEGKKVAEYEEIVTVPVVRRMAPDTQAATFWLKNRKADKWRDKQDHEITGKDGAAFAPEITITVVKPNPEQ